MANQINVSEQNRKDLKKKVLFIITQSEMGGAQKFLCTFLSHTENDKYNIILAFGEESGVGESLAEKIIKENSARLMESKIQLVALKTLKRNPSICHDIRSVFEIRKLIRKTVPDTLFLLSSKAGFVGSLASVFPKKIKGLKIIYRIGGWTFNDPWPKWKKWFWILLERLSAKWKDVIIVNNRHDLDQAKLFKIKPKSEVRLVYNGLDVYKTNFLPKEEARLKLFEKAARKSGRIFNAGIIAGTIANFYSPKGLEYLVETAEHFKNNDGVVFVVIGDGIERQNLEKLIIEKDLEKKVLLLGQIPNAYQLLPSFDIFVLPSVKEGFPWVVIEAMAAKLPVVATKVGAVPEIIEDGKNGMLVEPARPEQITKKIQELINDEYLRQELGIQAHQTILFKFPLEKMVKGIDSILSN